MDNKPEDLIKPGSSSPPPPQQGGSVMDVQTPQNHQPTTAPTLNSPNDDHQSVTPAEPTGAPAFHAAVSQPDIESVPMAPPTHHEQPHIEHHDPTPPHHEDDPHHLLTAHSQNRAVPIGVILAAILVAVVLIGLAVFAYVRTKDTTHPNGDHMEEETTTQQEQATPKNVDDATKEVDATLNQVDDTADLSEADMTDQALGL